MPRIFVHLLLVLFCYIIVPAVYAEAVDADDTDGASDLPVLDPWKGLTPGEVTDAQNTIDAVISDNNLHFNAADSQSISKQAQAAQRAEYVEWLDRMRRNTAYDPLTKKTTSELGGGFTARTGYNSAPRAYNRHQYIHSPSRIKIIESTGNLADDINKRAKKIAKKLEDSKYTCGSFDWVVQLKSKFNKEALTKYLDQLSESAIAAAPMAFLANWSPTLYEIVKWLRAFAGADLNAENISCQAMEQTMIGMGQRMLRGPGYGDCISANKHLGVTEAHKLCNGNKSAFDGLENGVGKIVGFLGKVKDVSLTKIVGDSMRTENPNAQKAIDDALEAQASTQKSLDAARVKLAANPDPGPAPAKSDPNYEQWLRDKDAYDIAQQNVDDFENDLQNNIKSSASAQRDGFGFWQRLGNTVADNLGGIIGDIRFGAKADVQIGAQKQFELLIKYDQSRYEMITEFKDALLQHYDIRFQGGDAIDLERSYSNCIMFCLASMKHPWYHLAPFDVDPKNFVTSHDVVFSYSTIDKLAFLLHVHANTTSNSILRDKNMTSYRYVEFMNLVTEHDLYAFLHEKSKKDGREAIKAIMDHSSMKQEQATQVIDVVKRNLENYQSKLELRTSRNIPYIVKTLHALNQFKIPFEHVGGETSKRKTPRFIPPTIKLGR